MKNEEKLEKFEKDYFDDLKRIKKTIRENQNKAMVVVNSAMIMTYYEIGTIINERKTWGSKYIQNLANDLKELKLINNVPVITSCPTCGRTQIDLIPLAHQVEEFLYTVKKDIHVAVMGCVVNGPGEAREADLGIAGGVGEALIFKKGVPLRKVKEEDIISELKKEIDNM